MEAVGAGACANTSMALKSVCVDSVEVGPREVVVGGVEAERWAGVVERVRGWLWLWGLREGWGEWRVGGGACEEMCLG